MKRLLVALLLTCVELCVAKSLVTSTTPPTTTTLPLDRFDDLHPPPNQEVVESDGLKANMTRFNVLSNVQFRYAHTVVETQVKNPSAQAQEVTFSMVLPTKAFVSNFSMILHGHQEYVARVAKKEEAKQEYDSAAQQGQAAALASLDDSRDTNLITISTSVEGQGKAVFRLTYEELLERTAGKYEHVIHVNLDQIVKDFSVVVNINESLPISNLRIPVVKTDPNAITSTLEDNPSATILQNTSVDPTYAQVVFKPTVSDQMDIKPDGVKGQFIVQYDVDHKAGGSDIQIMDGYFVHFFAPDNLPTLPKHVIFVLDTSGSMVGTKLAQTKDAMVTIMDDLTDQDLFNIITFSSNVVHWKPLGANDQDLSFKASKDMRREALSHVLDLDARGGTNIHSALLEAVQTTINVQLASKDKYRKPMIIFLTDGEATSGVTDSEAIKEAIKEANSELKVPIYGLAFGNGADFGLIKDISVQSKAFARRIYEAGDAAIQLEDFYLAISSPLLENVKFKYVSGSTVTSVTNAQIGTTFRGSEYVIAGKIIEEEEEEEDDSPTLEVVIDATGKEGSSYKELIMVCPYSSDLIYREDSGDVLPRRCSVLPPHPFPPHPFPPRPRQINFVERLWAFLTIQQLLDPDQNTKDMSTEARKAKAQELALEYNFVTKVTSLVVTRPKKNNDDDDEKVIVDPTPVAGQKNNFLAVATQQGYSAKRRRPAVPGLLGYSIPQPPFQTTFALSRGGGPPGPPGPTPFTTTTTGWFRFTQFSTTTITTRATSTTTTGWSMSSADMDYFASDADFEVADEEEEAQKDTWCNGTLTMYSKTYLRGDSVTLKADEADLQNVNFSDRVTSLQVTGNCCWELYDGANFTGDKLRLDHTSDYKSASTVRGLFRAASSVKLLNNCLI